MQVSKLSEIEKVPGAILGLLAGIAAYFALAFFNRDLLVLAGGGCFDPFRRKERSDHGTFRFVVRRLLRQHEPQHRDAFAGRSLDAKRALYRAIVDRLEPLGIPRDHVMTVLREILRRTPDESTIWSALMIATAVSVTVIAVRSSSVSGSSGIDSVMAS